MSEEPTAYAGSTYRADGAWTPEVTEAFDRLVRARRQSVRVRQDRDKARSHLNAMENAFMVSEDEVRNAQYFLDQAIDAAAGIAPAMADGDGGRAS